MPNRPLLDDLLTIVGVDRERALRRMDEILAEFEADRRHDADEARLRRLFGGARQ